MKNVIKLILPVIFMSITVKAVAQQKAKYDTLYYFLDLSNTPFNDRMITVDSEARIKFYTINCPCLKENAKPRFRCDTTRRVNIDVDKYKKIKLITLPYLIDLAKTYDFKELMKKYVIYFVRNINGSYTKNEVFLDIRKITTIIDFDTVHPRKKQ